MASRRSLLLQQSDNSTMDYEEQPAVGDPMDYEEEETYDQNGMDMDDVPVTQEDAWAVVSSTRPTHCA
jgi:hypothetical protein